MQNLEQLLNYSGKPPKLKRVRPIRQFRLKDKIKITDNEVQKITAAASVFCKDESIAAAIGVTMSAWKRFKDEHPEVQEYIDAQAALRRKALRKTGVEAAERGNFKFWAMMAHQELGFSNGYKPSMINPSPLPPRANDIPDDIGNDPNEAAKIYQKLMG